MFIAKLKKWVPADMRWPGLVPVSAAVLFMVAVEARPDPPSGVPKEAVNYAGLVTTRRFGREIIPSGWLF